MKASLGLTTLISIIIVSLLGTMALAQNKVGGILIYADSMYRDTETQTVTIEGNVQIAFRGQHLTARSAVIYLDKKEFTAEGDVIFITPKGTIGGHKVIMNYDTNLGTIIDGYVQSGPVIFEGSIIEKTGEYTYLADMSEYTACSTCPPAWSFAGNKIEAELGGYAYIKNAFLRFGGVPVFWLPYLIVPLKSQRQTGLLTPNFDYSDKGGLAFSQPFFWAISRNTDATYTARQYQRRGLKSLVDYRYVLSENSAGELDMGSLYDKIFPSEDRMSKFYPAIAPDIHRWFIKYQHYYDMPGDMISRAQVNMASDLQYPKDFSKETSNHGDPAMENRVSITKNWSNWHLSMDSSYYINLLKSDPLASNDDSVHRLPEIRLSSGQNKILNSNTLYTFDFVYTNFARNDIAYDNLSTEVIDEKTVRYITNSCTSYNVDWEKYPECRVIRDGKFDKGSDLTRAGQRLDIQPAILHPLQAGNYVDLLPRLTYRQTDYSFGFGDQPHLARRYIRADISAKTTTSRIFGDVGSQQGARYKHELQPEISATSIPWIDQPLDHPFYGFSSEKAEIPFFTREIISDQDLFGTNGVQFDYNDRVFDRNLITLRLNNKLIQKRWINNIPEYKQIAALRISQTYDAHAASRGTPQDGWSDVETILDLRLDRFETYTKLNYFPYHRVADASSRVKINDDQGNFLQVALTEKFPISKESTNVDHSARTEDYEITMGTSSRLGSLVGRVVYDANPNASAGTYKPIKSWAYMAAIKPPGDCWMIQIIHDQITGGDTNIKINFDFLFDGQTSTSLSSTSLDSYGF